MGPDRGEHATSLRMVRTDTEGTVSRTITVSSRALGPRLKVRVVVYDTLHEMRAAATRYNGTDHHDTIGATQAAGAHTPDRVNRRAHLNHHNEPFAHLYSDLLARLVDRLYALGYYQ